MTRHTPGLAGIEVADTRLSRVDGELGELVIAGLHVQDAATMGFAGLAGRLWEEPIVDWGAARVEAWRALREPGCGGDAMASLRADIARLSDVSDAVLVAGVAVAASAWIRRRAGHEPLAPDASLSHAADLLRMASATLPTQAQAHALDAYLATVMDHGLNASTFAARVVASTGSDRVSAAVAGLGALKGPLHGGAPGPVLDMLDAIAEPSAADDWLAAELGAGRRIMGMGHRVYRVRDPRASALEGALHRLEGGAGSGRLRLARAVEASAERLLAAHRPGRRLRANVEFYTAILLEALAIPREAFTTIFAASRVVGWVAHAREQAKSGVLIRPRARYVGPEPS